MYVTKGCKNFNFTR